MTTQNNLPVEAPGGKLNLDAELLYNDINSLHEIVQEIESKSDDSCWPLLSQLLFDLVGKAFRLSADIEEQLLRNNDPN